MSLALLVLLSGCAVGHKPWVEMQNDQIGQKVAVLDPTRFGDAGELIRADFLIAGKGFTHTTEDENGNIVLSGDAPYQEYFGVNSTCITVSGCTNPEALNYNELAGEDDGSCELPVVCEDNYNMVLMEL